MTTKGTHVLFVNRYGMVNVPFEEGTNHGAIAVEIERDVLDIVLEVDIADIVTVEVEYKAPATTDASDSIGLGNFCCSWNYKDCEGSEWCNANEGNCAGACNGFWLMEKDSVPSKCIALWGECTNDIDGCCTPSVCDDGNEEYRQCK